MIKKFLRRLAVFGTLASVLIFNFGGISASAAGNPFRYSVTRIGGSDRYDTSVKIAESYGGDTLNNVILATGDDFPDSLSGNVLAAKLNAPVLLVGKDVSSSLSTLNYIESKVSKSGNVYLLGGIGAVSQNIENYLVSKGYSQIHRLGGADRFETNKSIKNQLGVAKGTPVFLVYSDNFPDALSVSSIAAIKGWPIILTGSEGLSQSAKDMISDITPSQVYMIGGEGVLKPQIIDDIKKIIPTMDINKGITRISGQDRYATSSQVMSTFKLDTSNCVLATGDNFPDGIAGGALAAKLNASILLVNDDSLSSQKILLSGTSITSLTLLGGTGAISSYVENGFSQAPNGIYGFDCAGRQSLAQYKAIKSAGYSFVCRYYYTDNPQASWKNCLTADEARDITNAGLKVAVVYEAGGNKPEYFNYDQGKSDCLKSIGFAKAVGQPSNTPIYFAVDYDTAVNGNDFTGIDAYFNGVKDAMNANGNPWKIGVYGSNTAISHVYSKLGQGTYLWQTYAWSGGIKNPNYNIYQYLNGVTECGISIDRDISNFANNSDTGAFTIGNN